MNKEAALAKLLTELFPTQESLMRFVYSLPTQDSNIPRTLGASSTELMALWFVDELRRRGLIDARFFAHLTEEQPNFQNQIRGVRSLWLLESDEWSRPPDLEPTIASRVDAPTVIVSYSRNDLPFFEELSAHLSLLQHKGLIHIWHEGRIRAGDAWRDAIMSQIQSSDIFVLLVSGDFLASDFVWENELKLILARQKLGKAIILPIIIRPCLWQQSPIAKFQVLPADGRPVSLSPNPDRTWVAIARHIEKVARSIRGAK